MVTTWTNDLHQHKSAPRIHKSRMKAPNEVSTNAYIHGPLQEFKTTTKTRNLPMDMHFRFRMLKG